MLKKYNIIYFILAFCALQFADSRGQELEIEWERLYLAVPDSFAEEAYPFAIVPSEDDGFIIGSFVKILDGPKITRILKVDREGEIIWEYNNDESFFLEQKGLLKIDNGEYLFLTARLTVGRIGHPEIICINDNGEELWRRTYISEYFDHPFNMFKIQHNNIIMVGCRGNILHNHRFLYKLDHNGDVLEFRTYNFKIGTGCQISENSLLFTGYTREGGDIGGNITLFETDINLDSIQYDIYYLNRELMAGKVKMKPDGNILVKGSECFYPGPDPRIAVSNVFLIEFDQEREVIWHNTYGNQNYAEIDNDLLVFPDNRIAFSGETNLDYRFRARLFLTDPEGNEIGNLIDEGLGVAEFNKMLLTPEGELYVVGATREHFRDDYIYYLRLTRISYPNTVKKEDNVCPSSFKILSAYPNPFNSMTNVVISVNKHQKLSISVHDISGNYITGWISAILTTGKHTIYWDPNSSGSEIPSGVYNFIVRDKDQLNTIQLIKVN